MSEEISLKRTAAFCMFHVHPTPPSSSLKWGGGSSPLVTREFMRPFGGLQWVLCSRENQVLELWGLRKPQEPITISEGAKLGLTSTIFPDDLAWGMQKRHWCESTWSCLRGNPEGPQQHGGCQIPGTNGKMDTEDCPQPRCVYMGRGSHRREESGESHTGIDGPSKGRITLTALRNSA